MNHRYLTPEQNICASKIFLNTFGLILDDVNTIDNSTQIKIFDKNKNEVGILYFENNRVIMLANDSDNILKSSFDIPEVTRGMDIEYNNSLFGEWSTNIKFEIQTTNNIILSGEFLFENSVNSETGVFCTCHPLINLNIPFSGNITLKILRNGKIFAVTINSKNYQETIEISDWLNGSIVHNVRNLDYKKQARIANAAERGEDENMIHVFLNERENNKQIRFHNSFVEKVGKNNSRETLLQKVLLMQELNPEMFQKIDELRKILVIGEVSLLDNLIGICYDNFTDEDLRTILGIKRKQMIYQDGTTNLASSYYGIQKNNWLETSITKEALSKI